MTGDISTYQTRLKREQKHNNKNQKMNNLTTHSMTEKSDKENNNVMSMSTNRVIIIQ